MAAPTEARLRAFDILHDVARGELLDRAAERHLDGADARDRAWAMEAAYGAVRMRGRLDAALADFVEVDALDPVVREVLRLGAYQITEMDSVPAYAAVSESVELARARGRARAAGLVNAVLKRVAAREGGAARVPDDDLAVRESHPEWLVRRWLARFGPAGTTGLVEANNRRPDMYLRWLGLEEGDALARLEDAGFDVEAAPLEPRAVRLASGDPRPALDVLPAIVQDPAASAVARYAAAPEGGRVADLCAAPGGKAFALLDLGAGVVHAFDRSARRLRTVRDTRRRLLAQADGGLARAMTVAVADAASPAVGEVESVLIDAPCTGTGTFRRHPDGRWRVGPEDLASLVEVQARILRGAARVVAPGGTLVYATCSLEPEENEEQVERFLAEHPGFHPAPPAARGLPLSADGWLWILPQEHGVDGAFAARLERHG